MYVFKFIYVLATLLNTGDCFLTSFKPNHRGILDFLFNNAANRCNCGCGQPNREARFLGGSALRGHEFPWMVTLPLVHPGAPTSPATANGVIINDQYILTAASQVIGLTPYDVKVRVGTHDACSPDVTSTNMSVSSILVHPDFEVESRAHDLALLRLAAPVTFDRRVRPVCLPTPGAGYVGQVATISGWAEGETPAGTAEATCRPRKLGLPVLSPLQCPKSGPDHGCLGIIGSTSPLCKIDAGSPVMFRTIRGIYELIGILTDITDCRTGSNPALYTKTNENIKWILHNTRDACYCTKL